MLKKIREFFKQYKEEKGQGIVEYALILGFVAIIAVYMLTGSGLKDDAKVNVDNADKVAKSLQTEYTNAEKNTAAPTGGSTG